MRDRKREKAEGKESKGRRKVSEKGKGSVSSSVLTDPVLYQSSKSIACQIGSHYLVSLVLMTEGCTVTMYFVSC